MTSKNRTAVKPLANDLSAMVVALLLALLFIVLNAGSTGYGRNGGGDDEGSGIGGTGRIGPAGGTGESGFGGTGFKPYLGLNLPTNEVLIIHAPDIGDVATPVISLQSFKPSLAAMNTLVSAPEVIARDLPIETVGGAVDVAAEIQFEIDSAALFYADLSNKSIESIADIEQFEMPTDYLTVEHTSPALDSEKSVATPAPWGILASYLDDSNSSTENLATAESAAANSDNTSVDRSSQLGKIQRPELPPIQRIRPVERISVLPPRIQPMRI